jgi:hypothetical protein
VEWGDRDQARPDELIKPASPCPRSRWRCGLPAYGVTTACPHLAARTPLLWILAVMETDARRPRPPRKTKEKSAKKRQQPDTAATRSTEKKRQQPDTAATRSTNASGSHFAARGQIDRGALYQLIQVIHS